MSRKILFFKSIGGELFYHLLLLHTVKNNVKIVRKVK